MFEKKYCRECREVKLVSEFSKKSRICKKCYLARKTTRKAIVRRDLQIRAKKSGCACCGMSTDLMHWHHRDPASKSFSLTMFDNRSTAKIEAELKKCDPLCVSCHVVIHGLMKGRVGIQYDEHHRDYLELSYGGRIARGALWTLKLSEV